MNDPDELYAAVARAVRRLELHREEDRRATAAIGAQVEQLRVILRGQGVLAPGHERLLDKVAEQAARRQGPRVRLREPIDKYAMTSSDVDCASLVHLCGARCCAFSFDLTAQDVEEGVVRWELEHPYVIRHELDGYCTHLARDTGGCTVHDRRPATCRGYDCRSDPRVWQDFDQRIPAPLPEGLVAISAARASSERKPSG